MRGWVGNQSVAPETILRMDSPATAVRRSLAESRASGLPWPEAWDVALRSFERQPVSVRKRKDWRIALKAMEAAWRDAYVGAPPPKYPDGVLPSAQPGGIAVSKLLHSGKVFRTIKRAERDGSIVVYRLGRGGSDRSGGGRALR
jgi:hypothetical protein